MKIIDIDRFGGCRIEAVVAQQRLLLRLLQQQAHRAVRHADRGLRQRGRKGRRQRERPDRTDGDGHHDAQEEEGLHQRRDPGRSWPRTGPLEA